MKKNERKNAPRKGKPVLRVVTNKASSNAERLYFQELHKIIDKVFAEAFDACGWTWSQLAFNAGLGYETVANLGDRQTRWPRFSTIWRLCKAVGWDLSIQQPAKSKQKTLVLRKTA